MIVAQKGKIEAARGARGWNQIALAEQSGVSRNRVNAIETGGEGAKPQTAKKICDALGKSFDELFQVVVKDEE